MEQETTAPRITDADRASARRRVRTSTRGVVPLSLGVELVLITFCGWALTRIAPSLHGVGLVVWTAVVTVAVTTPVVVAISAAAMGRTRDLLAMSYAREREMADLSHRREFETQLAKAFEMADDEAEVLAAAGRGLAQVLPDGYVELLLADNSQAHLERRLVHGADETPGCPVGSPHRCIAARSGQTQVFAASDQLDAFPQLAGRPVGRCRAVCVPVSITGHTVGVLHRLEPLDPVADPAPAPVRALEVVASQLGARLGMLRVMAESQLQASTDSLTGLPNRRAFDNRVRRLHLAGVAYALVLVDLDRFKHVNDTYGHDTGDRALRLFSSVLRDSLRAEDIVCRYGGEEFAVALPGCPGDEALAVCERVRDGLAHLVRTSGFPAFTASFGIAHAADHDSVEDTMGTADAALYEAKNTGRDRAVLAPQRSERRDGSASSSPPSSSGLPASAAT